ncbi:MAG: TonB-dependent receptor [Sphingomonas sp.]|uniref:TonB-dependent receptor domain-containing protein n=1 Tax=Sphingomonas sp. TaxID=28214 RepID=UPI001AC63243|nr:TonB-dependent receptor [Sphingomonas sp.]MBN8814346.1 TonB-dependent receptor [Sphingomonas sp.]
MIKGQSRQRLISGTSFIVLLMASANAGHAQTAGAPTTPAPTSAPVAADPQEQANPTPPPGSPDIVVTGSRAITNGSAAPTPLTVVTSDQLVAASPGNLAEGLGQLPVFRGSTRSSSAGSAGTVLGAGASLLTLRALGAFRTLVLLDGRRITPSQPTGATDANLIPQSLVKRVDVVTGGASAAYGSDAVSGVVNFVLDTKFTGIKANLQGGISSRGDAGTMKAGLTVGKAFADGRINVVFAADYLRQEGIGPEDFGGRKWAETQWGVIGVSTTTTALIVAPDVRDALATGGGVITGCAPVSAACPLNRQQFLPGGALAPYRQGTFVTSATMSGGDGSLRRTNLIAGFEVTNLFGRIQYEIGKGTIIYAEGIYGKLHNHYFGSNSGELGTSPLTIFADNAYLPDAVRATMTANGITSFTMARTNYDFGGSFYTNDTATRRGVIGIDGGLGGTWKYSVYGAYGKTTFDLLTENNMNVENVYNAADAVRAPNGSIVCRSTLLGLARGNGCVPVNLFGEGSPSGEALKYILRTTYLNTDLDQLVGSASVRGEPFSLWAGPVSFAAGVEYRRETYKQVSGPDNAITRTGTDIRGYPAAQRNQLGAYLLSPAQAFSGDFSVKEGFVEINVPLLKDVTGFRNLSFNGAARYADYSTVGGVVTWKGGINWEPVNGLRFRGTRSRDIRAPSINELYSPAVPVTGQPVNDPLNGGARFTVVQINQGNPNLKEETANTLALGVVLRPAFLRGFTASVDYFNINIGNVIAPPTRDSVVNACGLSCPDVIRNPDGTINQVITRQQNLARLRTNGEDYEIGYITRLDGVGLPGTLSTRLLVTHTRHLQLTTAGITVDRVGDLNVTPGANVPPGAAEWAGSLAVEYRSDRVHLFVQERYIGSGFLDKTQTYDPRQDTRVPAVFYTDLTVGYSPKTLGGGMEIFFTVNNLFDKDPPLTPNGSNTTPRAANGALYDFIGRNYTAGVRFKF